MSKTGVFSPLKRMYTRVLPFFLKVNAYTRFFSKFRATRVPFFSFNIKNSQRKINLTVKLLYCEKDIKFFFSNLKNKKKIFDFWKALNLSLIQIKFRLSDQIWTEKGLNIRG